MFNIFVNDIFSINHKGKLILYADDMANKFVADNCNDLKRDMQDSLDAINQWMKDNNLCINENKTKYVIFRPKN